MAKSATKSKKPIRFKTLTYEQDLENKAARPKVKFTGNWSPRDLDRVQKHLRRALRKYKMEMIRKDERDGRRQPRPEWPYEGE